MRGIMYYSIKRYTDDLQQDILRKKGSVSVKEYSRMLMHHGALIRLMGFVNATDDSLRSYFEIDPNNREGSSGNETEDFFINDKAVISLSWDRWGSVSIKNGEAVYTVNIRGDLTEFRQALLDEIASALNLSLTKIVAA